MNFRNFAILLLTSLASTASAADRPNIVVCITDDQGYGDLASNGNPVIKTPNIDALAAESVRLTDYHVAPTCSPTRAALMTGHWTNRTGVWHTIMGRSMLRANEVTLGKLFSDAGYATGMFGKWHLGDNFPYRPEDRGFTEVYRHGGGGVGQTPDVWDNAYFDGGYFHNGEIEAAKGFCSDVFYEQGQRFIRKCVAEKKPFLAYISTNAPHGPLHCPQKYIDMYPNQSENIKSFYGMITNIDDNIGRTRELLKELGVYENTVFVFTTDNGTATGDKVFNAGMRGKKGSEYDGGHRVPFIVHWPNGGMTGGHKVNTLSHAVDVVPTLLDIAGVEAPHSVQFDGTSIRALLNPNPDVDANDGSSDGSNDGSNDGSSHDAVLVNRMLVTDSQRVRDPIKWRKSAVMSQGWRLVNGTELYNITDDPGQQNDIAVDHPERVAKMRAFYDKWWSELEPTFAETTEIHLGHPDHPIVSMTGHDWIGPSPPWNQGHIRSAHGVSKRPRGGKAMLVENAKHTGHWAIKVLNAGTYDISVMRWPMEAQQPIMSGLPVGDNVPGASSPFRARMGIGLPIAQATLRVDGVDLETKPVTTGMTEVTFTAQLSQGSHELAPIFHVGTSELGAYYAVAKKRD